MAVAQKYQGDVEAILARRYDNGWDYWTTPDKRLLKDSPFSALGSAKKDPRFLDALETLKSKLADGKIVVQGVNRKLEGLTFCRKGAVSELATRRYQEILENVG